MSELKVVHEPLVGVTLEQLVLSLLFEPFLLELLREGRRCLERVVRRHATAAVHLAHAQLAVGHAAAGADTVGRARARIAQDAHGERVDLLDAPRALLLVDEPRGLFGRERTAVALELARVVERVVVLTLRRVDEHIIRRLETKEEVALHAAIAIRVMHERLLLVCRLDFDLCGRLRDAELLIEIEVELLHACVQCDGQPVQVPRRCALQGAALGRPDCRPQVPRA